MTSLLISTFQQFRPLGCHRVSWAESWEQVLAGSQLWKGPLGTRSSGSGVLILQSDPSQWPDSAIWQ
jgi:hypothetical protein